MTTSNRTNSFGAHFEFGFFRNMEFRKMVRVVLYLVCILRRSWNTLLTGSVSLNDKRLRLCEREHAERFPVLAYFCDLNLGWLARSWNGDPIKRTSGAEGSRPINSKQNKLAVPRIYNKKRVNIYMYSRAYPT